MKKFNLKSILLVALMLPIMLFAQKKTKSDFKEPACFTYTWDTIPNVIDPDTNTNETGAIVLSNKVILEYAFDEKGDIYTYETTHLRIKITEDKALEQLNKIYVPMGDVKDLIAIKARFISPALKAIEVERSQMKSVQNLEDKGNFKIFAIEGGEKGGLLEYFYVLKRNVSAYGYEVMQRSMPIKKALFRLTCPEGLGFLVKSYNGFKDIKETAPEGEEINVYEASMTNIPGMNEEKYSAYRANLMRVEYTVAYNYNKSRNRIYSFNDISKDIYNNIMVLDKDEKKAVKKLIKEINIGKEGDLDKIRKIESYIKNNFNSLEKKGPGKLTDVIENRYADESGFVSLFTSIFYELEIKFELVITCDRFKKKFDPQFDSYNYLMEYLIYLPGVNKYMSPYNMGSRIGYIPNEFETNYGLFLRLFKAGDLESFLPSVKKIPASNYVDNADSLFISGTLNDDFSAFKYSAHRSFIGLDAANLQPYIKLMDEKAKKKMVDGLFDTETNNKLDSYEIKNTLEKDLFIKPLIIEAKVTAPLLVESAGNNVLLKIGEVIGRQAEMYQEKDRKTSMENENAKQYYRKIEVIIPEGYKITNAEDMNMHVVLLEDGKETAGFITTYELKGNKLIITNVEFYKSIYYPKDKYEDFRKVINAAADFNKKTLILTKK